MKSINTLALAVLALVATLVLTVSEAKAFGSDSDIEKIIGKNDLVAVDAQAGNIPFRYRSIVNAFGQIKMGCTATHIGQGYVLTAGHCFYAGETPVKNQPCGSDFDVEWGKREGVEPYLVSKCVKLIIAQRNDKMDYALYKVDKVPTVSVKANLKARAKLGDRITIFSHPEMLPLRWSKFCRVERVMSSGFPLALIHHVCDTNPGSSGATIIDVNTLQVIGIHDGGRAYNGVGYNYGTYFVDTPLDETLTKLGYK